MIPATFNQLSIAKNPYQGTKPKVLCVCSAGVLRSPTMANVLHQEFGFNTRAAGACQEYALIPVSEALLQWADFVVCAENTHFHDIEQDYPEIAKDLDVIVLDIADVYEWNHPHLKELIVDNFKIKKMR